MKHSFAVTTVLVAIFLLSQYVGLGIVGAYVDIEATQATGNLTYRALPSVAGYQLERPAVEERISFLWILAGVLVATGIILLLVRWRSVRLWRVWFFLAVVVTLTVSFGAFVEGWIAAAFAVVLGLWKVWRPNVLVHNITEIFIYAGLAAIFVPVMNLFAAVSLLVIIALYDAYAVWKSKHMVSMAEFQSKSGVFAGLLIPYGGFHRAHVVAQETHPHRTVSHRHVRTAVLGGGDIGFPLIFTGVVMKSAGLSALLIPPFAALALFLLLAYAKPDRFYPAMPFIAFGCFVGYGLVLLV